MLSEIPVTMDHRIILEPNVLVGKLVIRETRLSVVMAGGWREAEILANYPGITHEDVIACLAYARDRTPRVHPTSGAG